MRSKMCTSLSIETDIQGTEVYQIDVSEDDSVITLVKMIHN